MALTGTRCWFLTLLTAMLKNSPSYELWRNALMHGFWFSTRPRLDLLDFSGSYGSEGRRRNLTLLALLIIGMTETRAWLRNLSSGKIGSSKNLRKMSTFTLWIWLMTKVNKTQFCPRLSVNWANNIQCCFRNTCVSTGNSCSSEAKPQWKVGRGFNSVQRLLLIPLNRLLNFWSGSDEFEKQARTRKVTSTVRGYLYPVHRTPTDDPIYGGGNGPRWG